MSKIDRFDNSNDVQIHPMKWVGILVGGFFSMLAMAAALGVSFGIFWRVASYIINYPR